MTIAVVVLLVLGILFVYSSCYVTEELPAGSFYKRQIVWMLVGMICYAGFAIYDYRRLREFSWWAYGMCLMMLVMVLFFGRRVYGAQRWLMLFGVGIQPSELVKLTAVMVLARRLSRPGVDLEKIRPLAEVLAVVVVPIALIVKQPDLGTAMIFLPVAFVMMFVAGIPIRFLGTLAAIGVTSVMIILGALFLPQKMGVSEDRIGAAVRAIGLREYHRDRIVVFFQPGKDPLGAGWNRMQSQIAVGSGGAWGKGFRKGTQNILGFLPRSVAPTDFIYSVIAEEKGFFGSLVVLFLFGVVVAIGMQIGFTARDRTGRLLCAGIVAVIFCHVFINIAMSVGLMPITGLPLPLLSYGGSFMVVVMSALGIVQSVHIHSRPLEQFR